MSRIGRRTQRGLFALAMAAALGFGGAQAFASPGAAAGDAAARACTNAQCNLDCRRMGYDGGFCAGSWGCACWIQ
ncbi:MAG TPA: hypothetical protein VFR37_14915 [Longimicrobium sp.]|nr:hypothetical protein [Longimicrobium sp.]